MLGYESMRVKICMEWRYGDTFVRLISSSYDGGGPADADPGMLAAPWAACSCSVENDMAMVSSTHHVL